MNRIWLRWQTRIHRWLYRRTDGRIGSDFGAPVLLLTTTGRKSGEARTNPLFYQAGDESWAVVASNAGSNNDPAWWLNLQANPMASIQVKNRVYPVKGRAATETEQAELWPQLVEMFAGYEDYQRQSTRRIPVVILEACE